MSVRRGLIAGALLLAFGGAARADYDYAVVVTVLSTSGTAPATDLVILGSMGGPLTTSNSINTANISLISGNTGAPESITLHYKESVTINNPVPSANFGTTTIFGTMTVTNLTSKSAITRNTFTSVTNGTMTVGGDQFTIDVGALNVSGIDFQSPTVNGSPGGLSANVIITVPEPASLSLAGIGLAALLGYRWRLREVARRARLA
jgi:hypothetical protein